MRAVEFKVEMLVFHPILHDVFCLIYSFGCVVTVLLVFIMFLLLMNLCVSFYCRSDPYTMDLAV